jgi:hypothetical protein
LAFSNSDFSFGATYYNGAKLLTSNKNVVLIPDKFFNMNFWLEVLLIVQLGKLRTYKVLFAEDYSDFTIFDLIVVYVLFIAFL